MPTSCSGRFFFQLSSGIWTLKSTEKFCSPFQKCLLLSNMYLIALVGICCGNFIVPLFCIVWRSAALVPFPPPPHPVSVSSWAVVLLILNSFVVTLLQLCGHGQGVTFTLVPVWLTSGLKPYILYNTGKAVPLSDLYLMHICFLCLSISMFLVCSVGF